MAGRTSSTGIPFSGLDTLGAAVRRTTVQRLAVAGAALALLLLAALSAAQLRTPGHTVFEQGHSGVILLDFSRSVRPSRMELMCKLLKHFSGSSQRVGLVVFSDTAYELLPPGSPGSELKPLIRFCTPIPKAPHSKKLKLPPTPWDLNFRGGTQISQGLAAARASLVRQHVRGETVLLVSDLDAQADDLPRTADQLLALQHDGMRLRIAALDPQARDRAEFERIAGDAAFSSVDSLGHGRISGALRAAVTAPVPPTLVVAALVLLALLGANELWFGRLTVQTEEAA